MKLIAHRGNINGPIPELENTIDYIINAINKGFDCEIDVWKVDSILFLGHDSPEYVVDYNLLNKYKAKLWIHCKNLDALVFLKDDFNCFYHKDDTYTLTSKGYIWGNINSHIDENVIQVMPEKTDTKLISKIGVCSDYIIHYQT